jgi:hypothetical protein
MAIAIFSSLLRLTPGDYNEKVFAFLVSRLREATDTFDDTNLLSISEGCIEYDQLLLFSGCVCVRHRFPCFISKTVVTLSKSKMKLV